MIAGPSRVALVRSLRWVAWPHQWVAQLRALLYRRGWLRTHALPRPVISIGNLTAGGTGKTPVAILLAEWLLANGMRVAVLSRGYRRRAPQQPLLVSDGERLLEGPDEAGDEPYLIAQRCPRAIVAVGADRHRLGLWVLKRHPVDCFVLDDGFQHLHLHRDLDVLLVDVTDPAGLQAMLPVGRLREPLSAARRAHAILLTRANDERQVAAVWHHVTRACGPLPEPLRVRFSATDMVLIPTGQPRDTGWFRDRRALLFSGIANAAAFHDLVRGLGITVADKVVFADHARYDGAVLSGLRERARRAGLDLWITTEKDAGKVKAWLEPEDPCWAVRLSTQIPAGLATLEGLLRDGLRRRSGMEGHG